MSKIKLDERKKNCKRFSKIMTGLISVAKVSKNEFARRAGIASPLLNNYITGRATPNWSIIDRICTKLSISPNVLFGMGTDKDMQNLLADTPVKPLEKKKISLTRGRPKKIDKLKSNRGRPKKQNVVQKK